MKLENPSDRKKRIAMGVGGFLLLLAAAPCVLGLIRTGYAGSEDMVGMFGVGGLALLMIYLGVILLYQALKSPRTSAGGES